MGWDGLGILALSVSSAGEPVQLWPWKRAVPGWPNPTQSAQRKGALAAYVTTLGGGGSRQKEKQTWKKKTGKR